MLDTILSSHKENFQKAMDYHLNRYLKTESFSVYQEGYRCHKEKEIILGEFPLYLCEHNVGKSMEINVYSLLIDNNRKRIEMVNYQIEKEDG